LGFLENTASQLIVLIAATAQIKIMMLVIVVVVAMKYPNYRKNRKKHIQIVIRYPHAQTLVAVTVVVGVKKIVETKIKCLDWIKHQQ
jgi:uncharacterized membrane protein SirB2